MDFSASQMSGAQTAFVKTMIKKIPGWEKLTHSTQETERQALVKFANEHQIGCRFHWRDHANRAAKNISANNWPTFSHLIDVIGGKSTTTEEFNQAVIKICGLSPELDSWFDWWLRPRIAQMIFPACAQGDKSLRDQVSKTSNPIESQHSLLHRATGKEHRGREAIESLHQYVKPLERARDAIQGGYINAPSMREPTRRLGTKRVHYSEPNDGRAPDTPATLRQADLKKKKLQSSATNQNTVHNGKTITRKTTQASVASNRDLYGYVWANNSCYVDAPMEALFRVFQS
ncbi:hypothetical protein OF83DRAFT_1174376 [Amylostereum chailletii]|nr:hypothetical protein OF83DRAFT_1174376 [Amylostereum chailletii]